jgi:3-oxoacyl-[acyl-carrier protein] reductase
MKNILVTGASRGIGAAIVEVLHAEGYKVYGIYHRGKEQADKLQQKLTNVEMLQCDLSKASEVEELIEKLKPLQYSAIVNNAGIALGDNMPNFTDNDWETTFNVNLVAPLKLVLGLQDTITEQGSIVNVTSCYGMLWGMDMSLSYSATKAALSNVTKSLAIQLRNRKIRVNAVAPSIVDTDMSAEDTPEMLGKVAARTPLGRIAQANEVADVVSFLISNKASYINAQTLIVDGGYSAWDGIY